MLAGQCNMVKMRVRACVHVHVCVRACVCVSKYGAGTGTVIIAKNSAVMWCNG